MPWFIVGRLVAVAWFVVLVLLAGCGQNARTTKKGENVLHTTASLEQIRVAVGRVAMDRGLKTYQSEQKTTSVNGVESRWGKYTHQASMAASSLLRLFLRLVVTRSPPAASRRWLAKQLNR